VGWPSYIYESIVVERAKKTLYPCLPISALQELANLSTHMAHAFLHLRDGLLCQVGDLRFQMLDNNLKMLLLQLLFLNGVLYPTQVFCSAQLL